jgi:hypothetical protein
MEVTFQALANSAVGGKHLGPGGMTGVFKQAHIELGQRRVPQPGACGARVRMPLLTARFSSDSQIISGVGECGLSGVQCIACNGLPNPYEPEAEEEPGLAVRG